MDDCLFCKLIENNFMLKVYEDDWTVAFLDVAKDVDGHILVVPKKHVKNILDCDADTLSRLMHAVKKVSNHLVEHCGYEGVNLLHASDESAGQSVPHFHIHIIPRKRNDGIDAWPRFSGAKEELEAVYEKVRMIDR